MKTTAAMSSAPAGSSKKEAYGSIVPPVSSSVDDAATATTVTAPPTLRYHGMNNLSVQRRQKLVGFAVATFLLLTIPMLINYNDYSMDTTTSTSAGRDTPGNDGVGGSGSLRAAEAARTQLQPQAQDHPQQEPSTATSSSLLASIGDSPASPHSKQQKKEQQDDKDDDTKERFYKHQLVDHFRDDNYLDSDLEADMDSNKHWSNRYYQTTKYWKGPGHPIFVIVGGEGATDDGFFYPFVTEHLAKDFHAAVIQPEHRFYGPYAPVPNATVPELLRLLTVEQALADMVRLVRHVRDHHLGGCSPDRSSSHYCPIITVGGSYPGALSALFRVVYPDFVDIAYAASAPLLMYAQSDTVDPNVYYDIVTDAAERSSPGCAAAVQQTLDEMKATVEAHSSDDSLEEAARSVQVCAETIPDYIETPQMLAEALVLIASFKFADDNMGNYPPGNQTGLYQTCQIFQNTASGDVMTDFLFSLLPPPDGTDSDGTATPTTPPPTCFDIRTQIPAGGTTLDDTDGEYNDGARWDFQTCTDLVFVLGFSERSIFPTKSVSHGDGSMYDHLTRHCRERFGVTPRPFQLVEQWRFDDLSNQSYILFTNGLQDLWSGGSFLHNVSDTVISINLENGAHHSDLTHVGPTEHDTPDVRAGFAQIRRTLAQWLDELKEQQRHQQPHV